MRLLADEGVPASVVAGLRDEGHDVVYVAEMAPGITDVEVLSLANDEQRLLLTVDKDFGELVFRQAQISTGVLLVRLAGASADAKSSLVAGVLREHGDRLIGSFGVLSPGMLRIRPRR